MSRELTAHKINDVNNHVLVHVIDKPGAGNACHEYGIDVLNASGTPHSTQRISFQHGPVKEVGYNGITNEALLTILIDRMEGFQSGEFACDENQLALASLKGALHFLQIRTRDRIARGVEGTNKK